MENQFAQETNSNAFQVWMGQWRLTKLDREGSLFVLRFVLCAFRSRRPEDRFWDFLERFLFETDDDTGMEEFGQERKELLAHAGSLSPDQAQALMAYLSECYATAEDRLFWRTVSDAVQLYEVAPYSGRSGGTA